MARAVERFLDCGDLKKGFPRVRCPKCQHESFVEKILNHFGSWKDESDRGPPQVQGRIGGCNGKKGDENRVYTATSTKRCDSSECFPLSANSEEDDNSALNLHSEGDHGRIEPPRWAVDGPPRDQQGISLRFSSSSQRSFLLQAFSKIYYATTIRNQISMNKL